MYKLKTIARRSTLLGAASALAIAAVLPAALASAQALTPLTERSLLLSSSAPGYVDTDGSGYSTAAPNPGGQGVLGEPGVGTPNTFAPAGTGPNGKKSGQTFSFRISSGDDIRGLSFQYCTTAAGHCQAPGDNTGDARNADRETNAVAHPLSRSDLDFVGAFAPAEDAPDAAGGEFQIYVNNTAIDTTGWSFEKANLEDDAHTGDLTGKNNYVTLSHATGVTGLSAGDFVKVVFKADENIYITNPGSGHFFVKINTYSANGLTDMIGTHNHLNPDFGYDDDAEPADPPLAHNVIDGGVTVANVMTDSIHITTKVLETMAFSVGIQNPDTLEEAQASDHGTCDIISQNNTITGLTNNRLNLGNPNAEFSLETTKAWDVYSYWRLSSNSSGGATVYYSGNTLANTVGDEIRAMDSTSATLSRPGTEQFGLGFVDVSTGAHADTYSTTFASAIADVGLPHTTPTSYPFITVAGQAASAPFDTLTAQSASTEYSQATGTIDDGDAGPGTARFKFIPGSLTTPEPIAQQDETVISCATAKMRYVGNIAPDTPAGVYTTKVNYLAAPQY